MYVRRWDMIESNFEYTPDLLKKINANAASKSNLVNEIAMFVIAVGAVVAFIVGNTFVGFSLVALFGALIVSLIFTAKSIEKSNSRLLGQKVRLVFGEDSVEMFGIGGDTATYNAKFEYKAISKTEIKKDLIYVYFGRNSIIVIPKNSFKTEEECEKVIELVSNNYVV